ncbi:MAG: tetratricopeptide repeat protein, partial [Saccharothrix sp.]|nr:tetratricopeptide repeat protein [Saccharothrix sp.]
ELAEATDHLDRALASTRDDRSGAAGAHQSLAWVWEQRGDDRRALHHATSALHLLRGLGAPVREAHALNQAGWYAARTGDLDRARRHCEDALGLAEEHEDRDAQARILDSLGYVAHLAGRFDDAVDHYEQALVRFEEVGATYDYADTLERLGDTHADAGRPEPARAAWLRSRSMQLDQRRVAEADRLRDKLATIEASTCGAGPRG